MHIMLVNDDGIRAPGIAALSRALVSAGHRVSVCAPDTERSAASHSITLRRHIRAVRTEFPGAETAYAADGTPADCARLGLFLIPGVDAVVSGINNGSNMGGACIYSGTVAAATEASMSGRPALAVSCCGFDTDDYDASARTAVIVLRWMQDHPLPRGEIYNLNVPAGPFEALRGIRSAVLAATYLDDPDYVVYGNDEYGYTHGVDSVTELDPESDAALTEKGYATLTRLTWDLRAPGSAVDMTGLELHE